MEQREFAMMMMMKKHLSLLQSCRVLQWQTSRSITTPTNQMSLPKARQILGLTSETTTTTTSILRQAYFERAKECHPDSVNNNNKSSVDFLKLTMAYELLMNQHQQRADDDSNERTDNNNYYNKNHSSFYTAYSKACRDQLGVSVEIVEECKQNPAFRKWLTGRTDGAAYWRQFLQQHGGLAPVPVPVCLGMTETKQRRKRRR